MSASSQVAAWWNDSVLYKREESINQTGGTTLTNFPYLINGSTGFRLNATTAEPFQFVWSLSNISTSNNSVNYLYYNSMFDYVVANETGSYQIPHEIERGKGTNSNPTLVWDSNFAVVYHFENVTGPTLTDGTRYGRHATKFGGPTFVAGMFAAGLDLDGVDDRIDTGYKLSGNGSNLTVEGWFRFDNTTGFQRLWDNDDNVNGGEFIGFNTNDCPANIMVMHKKNVPPLCTFQPNTGQWYYLVATYEWNGSHYNMSLWVNGTLSNSSLTTNNENSVETFMIGRSRPDVWPIKEYFDGQVDEFRISDTVRSAGYVRRSFEMGLAWLRGEILGPACVQTCGSNADCDDSKPNTTDVCHNPGTSSSCCSHTEIVPYCGNGKCESPSEDCNNCLSDCACSSGYSCQKTVTAYACQPSPAQPSFPPETPPKPSPVPAPPLTCPSSCDDQNPCSIDFCNVGTGYQCRHDLIPDCFVPVARENRCPLSCEDNNTCTIDYCDPSTSYQCRHDLIPGCVTPSPSVPSIRPSPFVVVIEQSVRTEDLVKVEVDVQKAVGIAKTAAPSDKVVEVKLTKSGEKLIYEVRGTNKESFLFIKVDAPRKVTIDASEGTVVSVEKKSAFSVVIDAIVDIIVFWK